ncbi:hypothetical protein Saa2_04617 [Streptomyces acidiscabies]|nr:hypothetical protein Saa2_04617 [Streptomyces acidiscabies]
MRRKPSRLLPQRQLRPRRQHPRNHHRRHHRSNNIHIRGRFNLRSLLQDHVSVGATDPERGHPRPPRPIHHRPRPLLRQQLHRTRRPVHLRRRLIHMQGGRQHTLLHRQHHLDHTGDTGSRQRVTNVGLDRPQPQRTILRPTLPISLQQGLGLDRVPQPSARTVRLDHVHLCGGHTSTGQRLPNHPLLRRTIRRSQPVRRTVLIDRRTPHHRQHPMTITPSIRQPLHHQQPSTLTPPSTVSRRSERLATAIPRQPAIRGEPTKDPRRGHHRHTTGQRHRTLTGPQRLGRQMQRHQRRRTRRVHRHRRPFQPQRVRDPPRQHAARAADQRVALGVARGIPDGVVPRNCPAHEHAGLAALQRVRVDPGPLQRLPRRLQQQPLLRIHRQRLTRRNPEEPRVELRRVVKETAVPGVTGAVVVGVRVVEGVQ